jgi:hypothetical protein
MKDFLGHNLEIGDYVIMIAPQYRELALGKINAFTPKKVSINNWILRDSLLSIDPAEYNTLQSPKQLLKVDGPMLTAYILKRGY